MPMVAIVIIARQKRPAYSLSQQTILHNNYGWISSGEHVSRRRLLIDRWNGLVHSRNCRIHVGTRIRHWYTRIDGCRARIHHCRIRIHRCHARIHHCNIRTHHHRLRVDNWLGRSHRNCLNRIDDNRGRRTGNLLSGLSWNWLRKRILQIVETLHSHRRLLTAAATAADTDH